MSLTNVHRTFIARLDEISLHATFIDESRSVINQITPYLDQQSLNLNPALKNGYFSYKQTLGQVRPDDITTALTLQGCAAFEWYLRSLVVKSAESISNKYSNYSDVPDQVLQSNIHLTGRLLSIQANAQPHDRVNTDSYCKNLGDCHSQGSSFQLNSDVFGKFSSTFDGETIENLLKRVGFNLVWDDIGRNPAVKTFTGETGPRRAGLSMKAKLNDLVINRNNIAHRGDGSVTSTNSQLCHDLELLSLLASRLTKLVQDYLINLP